MRFPCTVIPLWTGLRERNAWSALSGPHETETQRQPLGLTLSFLQIDRRARITSFKGFVVESAKSRYLCVYHVLTFSIELDVRVKPGF